MPKIKRDSGDMDAGSSCQQPLEPISKRPNNNPSSNNNQLKKVSSNFSIESIMRSAAAEDCGSAAAGHSASIYHQQQTAASNNNEMNSPSVLSSAGSGSGHSRMGSVSPALSVGVCQSPATSCLSNDEDHDELSSVAGSGSSECSGSPRATTPIVSPGGHGGRDQNKGQQRNKMSTNNQLNNNSGGNNNNQNQNSGAGTKASGNKKSSSSSTWSKERGATNHLLKQQICLDPRLAPFECHLENLDLWHKFHPLDTEMIITKQGRRMFPAVRVTFSLNEGRVPGTGNGTGNNPNSELQLNPRDKYQVLMDILPYDHRRYRYAYHKSSWQQAGKADPPSPTKLFLHPDGPFTLDQLKRQVISFEKIKLTNNDANKHGMIVLNSMHKYQPRIHLVLWRGKESQNLANAPISLLEQEIHKTFIFNETIFTAVTAYQNHSITKLKIDSNPFAKGFRDSSRLTDLELESMQDLMGDPQCPFSPPRAPPHGFPHFLFAAAHHQKPNGGPPPPHGMEDPASALLRERTIMALDSFLQQHQQQQVPLPPTSQSSGSPHGGPPPMQQTGPKSSAAMGAYGPSFGGPPPYPQQPPPPSSQAPQMHQPQLGSQQLEQLIMQQQQQFAAAMAAAAAAHQNPHHAHLPPLHSLFGPPPPTSVAVGPALHQQQPSSGCGPRTTPTSKSVALDSPGGGQRAAAHHQPSLSPVAQAKQSPGCGGVGQSSGGGVPEVGGFQGPSPGGAASGHQQQLQYAAAAAAAAAAAFGPQHFQAVMAAHHQHQMAALGMQAALDHQPATGAIHQQRAHLSQQKQQQSGQLEQHALISAQLTAVANKKD